MHRYNVLVDDNFRYQALLERYRSFGEDLVIVATDNEEEISFSAWEYARERCEIICGGGAKNRGTPGRRGPGCKKSRDK